MDHETGQQIGAWLGGVLCGILGAVGGAVIAVRGHKVRNTSGMTEPLP